MKLVFMFNEDNDERRQTKTPFQQMEIPSEYCETHYYASISINKPDLVMDNKFWLDLANHVIEKKSFEWIPKWKLHIGVLKFIRNNIQ